MIKYFSHTKQIAMNNLLQAIFATLLLMLFSQCNIDSDHFNNSHLRLQSDSPKMPIDSNKSVGKIDGKILFDRNCGSCHSVFGKDGGFAVRLTSKYSAEWLYRWTTSAKSLIKSGDKEALRLFNENNYIVQPDINLTKDEVTAIYCYIDEHNKSEN